VFRRNFEHWVFLREILGAPKENSWKFLGTGTGGGSGEFLRKIMAGQCFLGFSREFLFEKAVAFYPALTKDKDKGGGDGRGYRNVFKAPWG
jgi:hypothetical protein